MQWRMLHNAGLLASHVVAGSISGVLSLSIIMT
jgi:hypothetical protein